MGRGLKSKSSVAFIAWVVLFIASGLLLHNFQGFFSTDAFLFDPEFAGTLLVTLGTVLWAVGRNIAKNMLALQSTVMWIGKVYTAVVFVSFAGFVFGDVSSGHHILFVLSTGVVGTIVATIGDGQGRYGGKVNSRR